MKLTDADFRLLEQCLQAAWEYRGRSGRRAALLAEAGLLDSEPTGRQLGGVFYRTSNAGRAALEQATQP